MPPPYNVARQKDANSCGFFAIHHALTELGSTSVLTPSMLQQRAAGNYGTATVPRIGDSEFNAVLAASNLNYKTERPLGVDGTPLPLSDALRGPATVFIGKARVEITTRATGAMKVDYHSVVITGRNAGVVEGTDSYTVLCSAAGASVLVSEANNFTYLFTTASTTYAARIESCQAFVASATPGGRAEPPARSRLGFFADLFSCCCCFKKPMTD